MKELGEAINESLSDSESIAEVVARIKEGGYDIFLVLEATIGVSKQGEHTTDKTSLVSTLSIGTQTGATTSTERTTPILVWTTEQTSH